MATYRVFGVYNSSGVRVRDKVSAPDVHRAIEEAVEYRWFDPDYRVLFVLNCDTWELSLPNSLLGTV